jgi:hypothetical protein
MIKHTMNNNGIIRNSNNEFIGFWDDANRLLHLNGETVRVDNAEQAMEYVGKNVA